MELVAVLKELVEKSASDIFIVWVCLIFVAMPQFCL